MPYCTRSPEKKKSEQPSSKVLPTPSPLAPVSLQCCPPSLTPTDVLALQRTIGNQRVCQLLGKSPSLIQRSPIQTSWGTWNDERYNPIVKEEDNTRGCDIIISFTPGPKVDAEKIGFLQTVRSTKQGGLHHRSDEMATRAVPNGIGAGYRIDTNNLYNPLFGVQEGMEGMKSWEKLDPSAWAGEGRSRLHNALPETIKRKDDGIVAKTEFGSRVGSQEAIPARLRDRPNNFQADKNSSQEFETTIVALKGNQEGMYYGSVRWGWQTDNEGKYTLLKFELASEQAPTEIFQASAKKWNETPYVEDAFGFDEEPKKFDRIKIPQF